MEEKKTRIAEILKGLIEAVKVGEFKVADVGDVEIVSFGKVALVALPPGKEVYAVYRIPLGARVEKLKEVAP